MFLMFTITPVFAVYFLHSFSARLRCIDVYPWPLVCLISRLSLLTGDLVTCFSFGGLPAIVHARRRYTKACRFAVRHVAFLISFIPSLHFCCLLFYFRRFRFSVTIYKLGIFGSKRKAKATGHACLERSLFSVHPLPLIPVRAQLFAARVLVIVTSRCHDRRLYLVPV